jgi:anti-sigma-K factor RskA
MVLAMHDLPANGGSEVYTAWVIVGSNAPTSVGDFSVGSTGIQSLTTHPTTTPEGATIAITREPNPGNQAPKGPIVSAGVATAPPGTTS